MQKCVNVEFVQGERLSVDGTAIAANASSKSRVPREQLLEAAKVWRTLREYPAEVECVHPTPRLEGESRSTQGVKYLRTVPLASGLLGIAPARLATEHDQPAANLGVGLQTRQATAQLAVSLASRGVRSSVVRLPPTVHGKAINGFMAFLVAIARDKRVSGYIAEGANRWPAVHRLGAARLFRLALETAPAGSVLQANAEEGVPIRAIAEVIGRHLNLPTAPISHEDAAEHFGWLASFLAVDSPASSALTRELLGWNATHAGLIDDLESGHYFNNRVRMMKLARRGRTDLSFGLGSKVVSRRTCARPTRSSRCLRLPLCVHSSRRRLRLLPVGYASGASSTSRYPSVRRSSEESSY